MHILEAMGTAAKLQPGMLARALVVAVPLASACLATGLVSETNSSEPPDEPQRIVRKGDIDCYASALDVLVHLLAIASLEAPPRYCLKITVYCTEDPGPTSCDVPEPYFRIEPGPTYGPGEELFPPGFDLQCDGSVDVRDTLWLLRYWEYVANYTPGDLEPEPLPSGCPHLGAEIPYQEAAAGH